MLAAKEPQMPYPGAHATARPNHPAVVLSSTGEGLDYRLLNERSNRIARFLKGKGFCPGDHVAILMENNVRYFEIVWAALRSGLVITPINRHLTADEAAYIIRDCDARALFTSANMAPIAETLTDRIPQCWLRLVLDGVCHGYEDLDEVTADQPPTPLAEEHRGHTMLYSSGTTGQPKGIVRTEPPGLIADGLPQVARIRDTYGIDETTIYLSPAPIYHAAPLHFSIGVMSLGGSVVMMPRFDAEEALRCIQDYRITYSQWVPTMFVRLLKLPEAVRHRYDLSSHKVAIHAAAPCPVEIKRRMINWWGPIIHEYYAASEGNGLTAINSDEWLERPGSVGRARLGTLHVCDDKGKELPPGATGLIYFEREEMPFSYHKDPEKTSGAQHPSYPNWSTLGDIGYLDEDGYLFLTDRESFMIISGGVNIYPQVIEDVLVLHPKVADAAVIGVPNEEYGEEVKAVVQPAPGVEGSDAFAQELISYTREHIAAYMVPRSVDFTNELPRLPTGKLYKHKLRKRYL